MYAAEMGVSPCCVEPTMPVTLRSKATKDLSKAVTEQPLI